MQFSGSTRLFAASVSFGLVLTVSALVPGVGAAPGDGFPDLDLGPFGPGVVDGTAPFDTTGNCPTETPGDDCSDANGIVRSQDTVSYVWSVTGDDFPLGQTELVDVVMEQTITPSAGADVAFEGIPAICTPAGGGGSNPPSELIDAGNGATTLVCNLGSFTEGQQKSFSSVVSVSGNSLNGETFVSSQQVYTGDPSASTPDSEADITHTISAAPAYDLSQGGWHSQDVATRDVGNGPELGYLTYLNIRLAADRRSGIESLAQPFTFTDTISAMHADGITPYTPAEGFEAHVLECRPNVTGWGDEIWGTESIRADVPYSPAGHAPDSGDCTFTGDSASGFTFTIDGADLSGERYPTRTIGGTDLGAGPYYVLNHRVQVFVPFRSIDIEDGAMDDVGALHIYSEFQGFDPASVSGTSNFGPALEPLENNGIGPSTLQLTVRGSFAKYAWGTVNNNGDRRSLIPSQTGNQAGDGELEPGQSHASVVRYINNGTVPHSNPLVCDVFDNTTQLLTDAGDVGATGGRYAFVGAAYVPAEQYVVEYAHYDFVGDDPLSGGFDASTSRYLGTWDAQSAVRCEDAGQPGGPVGGWHADPSAVSGGIDAVNAVRVRTIDPQATMLMPSERLYLVTPLTARDTFNGGPHAGEAIPEGTVLADFGMARSDSHFVNWTNRNYQPSPENASYDGDRVTLVRLRARLESRSIEPAADVDVTGSTVAGNQIVWELLPTLQSSATPPGTARNVVVVDVLPPDATYNASCTAATSGGTPASTVTPDTDADGNPAPGYTRLTWNLGDRVANEPITPLVICTDSNSLAPDGTSVVNYAEIRADNVVNSVAERSDGHSIVLQQTGSMQLSKQVDAVLDDLDDDQVYTLSWANFAATFEIDPPVVIDVFPFMSGGGDGVGSSSPRLPASDFNGSLTLTGPPTVTWLDGSTPEPGDPSPALGVWEYTADAPETIDYDPDNNTSTWCTESEFGSGSCPGSFAAVTGLKFTSAYPLARDGDPRQGMRAVYSVQATDNQAGDLYTNRFTLDSTSLPAEQFLRSNNVSVQVAAFSIGDFIFADLDGDGRYGAGDTPAPDGVVVELRDDAGTLIDSTTTSVLGGGRYLFQPLASGDYRVVLPATNFSTGGALEGWTAAPSAGLANADADETMDQNASAGGGGVQTDLLTLSSTPPATPGGQPLGDEPLGDNSAGLADPTLDGFSNLTLDLGLVPPTAILIVKEICDPASGCDVSADADWVDVAELPILDDATWRITVTNTGDQPLTDVVVSDPAVAACDATDASIAALADLAPGESASYTCVSPAVTDGFTNTATATATPTFGEPPTDSDSASVAIRFDGTNSIGDLVWLDADGEGDQDEASAGLGGVEVTLTWFGPDGVEGGGDDVASVAITAGDGSYLFGNLPDGAYALAVTAGLPGGLVATFDETGAPDGASSVVGLAGGTFHDGADFGFRAAGSIGDMIWWDVDGNGTPDAGEPPLPGVEVIVSWFGPDGVAGGGDDRSWTATSDAAGTYLVGGLPDGVYSVAVDEAGVPAVLANSADPDGGLDGRSTVVLQGSDLDQDFGYRAEGSIGDRVWFDVDGDGVQDPAEPGVAGVSVTVAWLGADGVAGGGDDRSFSTTTDAAGDYLVGGLPAGAYEVVIDTATLPAGSSADSDLDAGSASATAVTLGVGESRRDVDYGIVGSASLGRSVWGDTDADGLRGDDEVGIAGVTVIVTWHGPDGDVAFPAVTLSDGSWALGGLPEGDYSLALDPTTIPAGLVPSTPESAGVALPAGGHDDVDFGLTTPEALLAAAEREGLAATGGNSATLVRWGLWLLVAGVVAVAMGRVRFRID